MRRRYPTVIWANYSYGYEARLAPRGPAFARARMVRGEPGIHYELIWIYGPRRWRPERVLNVMTIERHVERYVACHRGRLLEQVPPDPLAAPGDLLDILFDGSNRPEWKEEPLPWPVCDRCGRRAELCRRMMSARDRRANHGWACAA